MALSAHPQEMTRKIRIDPMVMTYDQFKCDEYDRAYDGRFFENLILPWDCSYDESTGIYNKEEIRKPFFETALGKKVVETHAGFLWGKDVFPVINLTATTDIFNGIPLPIDEDYSDEENESEEASKNNRNNQERLAEPESLSSVLASQDQTQNTSNMLEPDSDRAKSIHSALQRLLKSLLSGTTHLDVAMLESARMAIRHGYNIITVKNIDGNFYLEPISRKFVYDLKLNPTNPNQVLSFSYRYLYEAKDDEGHNKVFWFRRDYNIIGEVEFFPVEYAEGKNLGDWQVNQEASTFHNLGICLAVINPMPGKRSILEGMVDKIISYSRMFSNRYKGVRSNMDALFALFTDPGFKSEKKPARRGEIMVFEGGRDIKPVTTDMAGYQEGRIVCSDIRKEILDGSRVIELDEQTPESGKAKGFRLIPQQKATDEYRVYQGDMCLINLLKLLIQTTILLKKTGQKVNLGSDVIIPVSGDVDIDLNWPSILPMDEAEKGLVITNASTAVEAEFIEWEDAVKAIAPLYGADPDRVIRSVLKKREKKKAEEEQLQFARSEELLNNAMSIMGGNKNGNRPESEPRSTPSNLRQGTSQNLRAEAGNGGTSTT